jgi:hypothetical protein
VRVVAAPPRADDRRPDGAVAEGGVLRMRTTYRIDRVEVDVVGVLRALGRPASETARPLVANPADDAAVEAFRAAVRPSGDRPGSPALGCDVVAVGDEEVEFAYRVGTARLDVAALLAGSAELARAFAEQVASARSGGDRRPFDAALRGTVRPEHLGAIAAGLPGRTPVLVMEPGRRDAVDAHYAPVVEPPTGDARHGADMYQALAVGRANPAEPEGRPAARRRTAGSSPRREPNGSGGPGR